MNKIAPRDNSRKLDQFYTDPVYAQQFYNIFASIIELDTYDYLLEPSAGTGSFYNLLDVNKRIGLDLDPKAPGIIKINFFDWTPPTGKIATVGNPPFGKNSNLAVKFFNKAAMFSDVIAFVIPRTFRKSSVINRLNKNFHKIYDEIVPANSFIYNEKSYDVPCVAQIWERRDSLRDKMKIYKLSQVKHLFELVDPSESDFAIQRVGGRAGLIRISDRTKFSKESHYFIKSHDAHVLPIFERVDFDSVKFNTAGNPSVSPSELIELWLKEATSQGIEVVLMTEKIEPELPENFFSIE